MSFQVPILASSAKTTAAPTRHSVRVSKIVLVFMFPPVCRAQYWGLIAAGTLVLRDAFSNYRRARQCIGQSTPSGVWGAASEIAMYVSTVGAKFVSARSGSYVKLSFVRGSDMRVLNILSGIAVLFTTGAFGHLLHRHFVVALHDAVHGPAFWIGMAMAGFVEIFSFIGACLLLRSGR